MSDWLRDSFAPSKESSVRREDRTVPPPPLRVPGGESAGARSTSMPPAAPTSEDWVRSVLDNHNG